MRIGVLSPWALAALLASLSLAGSSLWERAQAQKKDYLSQTEADKVRDAETPNERIKLYVSFAADRLKKFQYELGRTQPDLRRGETLNGLLNAYVGCIDDAADLILLGSEKQLDVRTGVKELQTKGKAFLETLEKLEKAGPELKTYRETLEDAIEGTRDALNDAEKTAREAGGVPVRRKP